MTIEKNIKLDTYTTLGVGGYAEYFVRIASVEDLEVAVVFGKEKNIPILVMAGGSNVLISDNGFNGLVIKIEIKGIEYDNEYVTVGAGENLDSFVADVVSKKLYGIENLSGIPGTVGATPVQNVGAYGVDVSMVIDWVEVFDTNNCKIKKISNKECNFEYRSSIFKKKKNYIITRICFKLKKEKELVVHYKDIKNYLEKTKLTDPSIADVRCIILEIRGNKFPNLNKFGTAGSFFKNPVISEKEYKRLLTIYSDLPGHATEGGVKIPLAWLLDTFGWKSKKDKNVNVFHKQPLVLVCNKNATAEEIKSFAKKIMSDVKAKTGIDIVPEVTFIL